MRSLTRSMSLSLLTLLVLVTWSTAAHARSFRVNQVPNGGQFGCALCHTNENGGGMRNGFGAQVENTLGDPKASADVKWETIWDKDGDADGYSNGFELGDPDGEWRIGDPNPGGETYAPFDRDDSPCGDGEIMNPPEECDGENLNGMTCEDLGWGPGELTCNIACRFNESQCGGYMPPNADTGNNATTNGATNQSTNGMTDGGDTNGDTTGAAEDDEMEPSGCCATVAGSDRVPGALATLLIVLIVALRRRSG